MAYDPALDDALSASNDALNKSFAKNPVIPNPRPVTGGGAAPQQNAQFDASGAVIGGPSPFAGLKAALTGGNLDNAAAYGPDVLGGNTVSAPYNGPVIAPSVTRTRTEPVATPASPATPITNAANEAQPQSVPVGYRTLDVGGPAAQTPVIGRDYGRELALNKARDSAEFNDRLAVMRDQGARAGASQDLIRAQGDARVANFNREMARLDVAGNIGGPGNIAALDDAAKAAGETQKTVDAAQQRVIGAPVQQSNPLDNELKVQEGLNRDQVAQTINAREQTVLAGTQQALQQQKRLTDLGSQLAAETDTKKRQQLQDTILTLLGKEKGDRYKVIHAQGGEVLGPDGLSKIKQPDSIVVHDSQSGQVQILPLGQPSSAAPLQNHIDALKKDPKLASDFDKKYGAGASKQYLNN
jgi:hypothetical protein